MSLMQLRTPKVEMDTKEGEGSEGKAACRVEGRRRLYKQGSVALAGRGQ